MLNLVVHKMTLKGYTITINWPTWASIVLITHPILQICPTSDYHLFPGLKKQLKGRHFSSDAEVNAAAETWLDGKTSEFFLSGV